MSSFPETTIDPKVVCSERASFWHEDRHSSTSLARMSQRRKQLIEKLVLFCDDTKNFTAFNKITVLSLLLKKSQTKVSRVSTFLVYDKNLKSNLVAVTFPGIYLSPSK